jgi:chemotaxis family two-component system sensor kinase Cph1
MREPYRRLLDAPTLEDMQIVSHLGDDDFDQLPFGAIRLDEAGVVTRYNLTESRFAGRDPARVLGRNFFTEVAPCTNVREFAGRFHEGVAAGFVSVVFPYRFVLQNRSPEVVITLFYAKQLGEAWVFVREGRHVPPPR